jgi:nucleoside-diphosphate kinase
VKTPVCNVSTVCVLKGLAGKIIADITRANYNITGFELFYLDRTHADEFYEIYKGVLAEYSVRMKFMITFMKMTMHII